MLASTLLKTPKLALNATRAFSSAKPSIAGFFNAKSFVIVGASLNKGALGNIIAKNFNDNFKGDVYYVNPKGIFSSLFSSDISRRWTVRYEGVQAGQRDPPG